MINDNKWRYASDYDKRYTWLYNISYYLGSFVLIITLPDEWYSFFWVIIYDVVVLFAWDYFGKRYGKNVTNYQEITNEMWKKRKWHKLKPEVLEIGVSYFAVQERCIMFSYSKYYKPLSETKIVKLEDIPEGPRKKLIEVMGGHNGK